VWAIGALRFVVPRAAVILSDNPEMRQWTNGFGFRLPVQRWAGAILVAALTSTTSSCHGNRTASIKSETYPQAPVIIVSIDTLRADHLPAYGYTRIATPNIDAFRNDALLFEHAYSHVPLTLPSHVSMLTGLLPPDNGVRNNIGFRLDCSKHITIPQLLKRQGYATGGAVSAYVLRGDAGLTEAFDFYDDKIALAANQAVGRLRRPGRETTHIAEEWIDGHRQAPFLFFLHLFEPHAPYEPAPELRGRYELPYDGAVASADAVFGDFMRYLKRQGIYDRAIIVLMSDHGEGLGQHGEDEHGIFLYMEDIHIPLMLKLPASRHAKISVSAPVQLTDVLPTITAVTGTATPAGVKGRSLIETALNPALEPRRIYGESLYGRIHLGWAELRSLVDDRYHFIDAPRPELYSVKEPSESRNILTDERRVYASMSGQLSHERTELPVIGAIDPEEAKKLSALGYLGNSSPPASGPLPDPKDGIAEIAMMKRAASYESAGKLEESLATFQAVVRRNPRLTDALVFRSRLLERMGRYDEAIAAERRAVEVSPSLAAEAGLTLGNLYLMTGRPKEAAENAALSLRFNPGSAHIILGRAALAQGQFDDAEANAQVATRFFNYTAPGMVLLAQTYAKRGGRFPEALSLIDRARAELEQDHLPMIPLLFFVKGDVLARMNRPDEAKAAFEEEIRLFPYDTQAYASLAVVDLLTGDRAAADRTMQRLVAATPGPAAWLLAVRTFRELGDQALAHEWQLRARRHGFTV
jgi:arylsulfatase A-like enzyme/Flp pilus assembly protein TadD